MSKKNIVEHMEHGITIHCADGALITCKPLMLGDAKFFMQQLESLRAGDDSGGIVWKIVERFADRYPELHDHISPLDLIGSDEQPGILYSFFWGTTGASVVPRHNGRTGTPSSPNTSQTGDTIPT